ncbi:MAG: hypothetical protein V3V03_07095 [Hyphomonadaceae bacterium]
MKLVKVLLIVIAVLAIIAAGFWQFFLKDQIPYARVATAYGAKQVCSCRFVAEREMASCMGDFTLDISAVSFEVASSRVTENGTVATEDTVIASVLGGLIKSEARFEPGLGCALVKPN